MTNEPNAILCRTNAGCVAVAIHEHTEGRKVALIISGGLKGLKAFADGADSLMMGQRTDHPELAAFADWSEVLLYIENDEGADLRPMVKLIEKYGTEAIYGVCRNSLDENRAAEADVTVCTCHKAKGLEWDRVRIHNDFTPPKDGGKLREDDIRLLYVAVTRARLHLDYSAVSWAVHPTTLEG